jgi:hypothetical protein
MEISMSKSRIGAFALSGLLVLAIGAGGCGKGSSSDASMSAEVKHMRHAAGLVGEYQQAAKKKKQPAKIQEVRDWAIKEGKASEEDFVSTRDKEPYAIAFTTKGLVVHEQDGKNGKCYMLSMGSVSEISLEDARHLVERMQFGQGGRPQRMKR